MSHLQPVNRALNRVTESLYRFNRPTTMGVGVYVVDVLPTGHEATMERRKFIAAMGSVAAGAAATMGTGAFTSVTADRSVDVAVAGDSSAYLGLRKAAGDSAGNVSPNSETFVSVNGGEVSFDFSSSNSNTSADLGNGFNPNAVTVIEDLIEVQNQGTQSAFLSVDTAGLDLSDGNGSQAGVELAVSVPDDTSDTSKTADEVLNENIAFNSGGDNPDGGDVADPTTNGAYELNVGESVHLDLTVDTTVFDNNNVETGGNITFIADQSSGL
jgi:hypothetical protein